MSKPRGSFLLATLALLAVLAFVIVGVLIHRPGHRRTMAGTEDAEDREGREAPSSEPRLPSAPRVQPPRIVGPSEAQAATGPQPGPHDLAKFDRQRGAPGLISNSGNADRQIGAMSETFLARFHKDLPKELAAQVSVGKLDCFHDGCVMAVDYKGDVKTAREFESFMVMSEAFTEWPGPKMRIEKRPGDRLAGESWCFFRSSEAARALLSD